MQESRPDNMEPEPGSATSCGDIQMFQGRDFSHDAAFPRLGRGLAIVKCMAQAP
jgi:hypothetical protein